MGRAPSYDVEGMAERVSAVLSAASAAERRAGREWYATAREAARVIAAEADISVDTAAGIIAAWSPRAQWADNLSRARRCARGEHVPGLGRSRAAAERIRAGEHPLEVLRGPKTRSFYRNIVGDPTAITVDIWAARAAGWSGRETFTAAQYAAISEAYRRAAAAHRLEPSTAQAIAWVATRGRAA